MKPARISENGKEGDDGANGEIIRQCSDEHQRKNERSLNSPSPRESVAPQPPERFPKRQVGVLINQSCGCVLHPCSRVGNARIYL